MARTDPTRELDLDVELAAVAHQRLLTALDAAVERGQLAVDVPSRLPGWTVGHVITHVTDDADSHVRLFDAAAAGAVAVQYPDGSAGRAADIELGSSRPLGEQVDALRRSVWTLEGRWAASTWVGYGTVGTGARVPLTELPFRRAREVLLHHIDLGEIAGSASFEDLPPRYLRKELARLEMLWKARQPMGMTALPAAALAASTPERLAWLTGRGEIDGLRTANLL